MDDVDDAELLVERVAALDLGKAVLEACVRVPHPQRPGRPNAGAARLRYDHRTAVGDGGLVSALAGAADLLLDSRAPPTLAEDKGLTT